MEMGKEWTLNPEIRDAGAAFRVHTQKTGLCRCTGPVQLMPEPLRVLVGDLSPLEAGDRVVELLADSGFVWEEGHVCHRS